MRNAFGSPPRVGARWPAVACCACLAWASPAPAEGADAAPEPPRQAEGGEMVDVSRALRAIKRAEGSEEIDRAVAPLRPAGGAAVRALLDVVTTARDEETRLAALIGLIFLGPAAQEVAPVLARLAGDDKGLGEKERAYAMAALRAAGPDWGRYIPFLVDAVHDDALFGEALSVLEGLGRKAKAAVPGLITKAKKKPFPRLLTLFGHIGPAAKEAIPVLLDNLARGEDHMLRDAAAWSLGEIRPHTKEVVPALVRALRDKNSDVRETAADALGRIGPAAKAALPELRKALKDERQEVRRAAREAIATIKKKRPG